MDYPAVLLPHHIELVPLPRGSSARIARCSLVFTPWKKVPDRGRSTDRRFVLDGRGRCRPVEQLILKRCETEGWRGVYFEEFGNRVLSASGEPAEVPAVLSALLTRMFSATVSRLGCFNFLLWKGEHLLAGYATRSSGRKIRTPQLRWIGTAIEAGLSADGLLIVEWGDNGLD